MNMLNTQEIEPSLVYMHLNIRHSFGNKDVWVGSFFPQSLTVQVKQKWDSNQCSEQGTPKDRLCYFHCALFKRKVAHWELVNKCCAAAFTSSIRQPGLCFVLWKQRKWWFSFHLWHLIRGHLHPESLYFMGTENWDENGCYLSHKTFFIHLGVAQYNSMVLNSTVSLIWQKV